MNTIKLAMTDPSIQIELPATVIGSLALHRYVTVEANCDIKYHDTYTISHYPSGYAIISDLPLIVAAPLIHNLSQATNWSHVQIPLTKEQREFLQNLVKKEKDKTIKHLK